MRPVQNLVLYYFNLRWVPAGRHCCTRSAGTSGSSFRYCFANRQARASCRRLHPQGRDHDSNSRRGQIAAHDAALVRNEKDSGIDDLARTTVGSAAPAGKINLFQVQDPQVPRGPRWFLARQFVAWFVAPIAWLSISSMQAPVCTAIIIRIIRIMHLNLDIHVL